MKRSPISLAQVGMAGLTLVFLTHCARTEIVESPKTAIVAASDEAKTPKIIWTSRTMSQNFDYLGQIDVRSWTYDGAIDRLLDAGRQLRADAVIDVSYRPVGFLTTLHAFAVKFKD